MADAAARWPSAGALGPLIRNTDGEIYPSARALPSLGRGIGHALPGGGGRAIRGRPPTDNERGAPQEGPVGWLSGSCLLVRRAAFDAVGGFDPDYFMYFEDVDLGERLGRAGWQNVYVPRPRSPTSAPMRRPANPRRMATEHHAAPVVGPRTIRACGGHRYGWFSGPAWPPAPLWLAALRPQRRAEPRPNRRMP